MTTFTLSLNTSTIRCGTLSLEQTIDVAAQAGYQGIELWVRELDEHVARGGSLDDIATRLEDKGLACVNLIGFFEWAVDDPARRRKGLDEGARAFALAQAVGCRMVAAPPMGITGEAGMSCHALAERYAAVIDRAAESGVTPVLEFWGMSKTLGCLGEALFVAAECGRAQACVLADVFHMYKSSGQFAGLNLLGPKTLGMFHLNDYPASPPRAEAKDSDRVYPGDGVAPLKEIAAALRRAGYAGAVSLELFNKSYWEQDALTVARTGLAKMRAALSR